MASLYSLFTDVSPRRQEEAALRFVPIAVAAGEAVATEGEINDAMLFVESGEVRVIAGGFEVTRMGPGSIIGEIGLFTHAVRTATVEAATDVQLQTLSRRAFAELRNASNPIAFRIEKRAVAQLASRMRQLSIDVAEVATITPSVLQNARTSVEYSGHPIPLPTSRLKAALKAALPFHGASTDAVERLGDLLEARTFQPGETLAAQNLGDGPLYVLAHGTVDCVAAVGRSKQVRVATLDPGSVFNVVQNIDEGLRPMSFVARDGVTVLAIRRDDVFRLLQQSDRVGSTVRIAIIRSLSDRVNQANASFALARLLQPTED